MTSVMERLICKVCGHDSDEHKFAIPIKCTKCPKQICQPAKKFVVDHLDGYPEDI